MGSKKEEIKAKRQREAEGVISLLMTPPYVLQRVQVTERGPSVAWPLWFYFSPGPTLT